ncbi:hypothetical protein HMPREF0277_1034, partial [Corynebacterium accolens ATCC 49726]
FALTGRWSSCAALAPGERHGRPRPSRSPATVAGGETYSL